MSSRGCSRRSAASLRPYSNISSADGLTRTAGGGGARAPRASRELGIGVAQQPVAEVDDVAPVLLRRAEHLGEHPHRQLRGDVLDEVELAERQRVVEDPVDELADLQLVGPDRPRREALGHQRAQLVVARGVHVDHRLARLDLVGAQVLQRRPAGLGRERLPVAVHGVDVVVARDAPEAADRRPRAGRTRGPRGAGARTSRAGRARRSCRGRRGRRPRAAGRWRCPWSSAPTGGGGTPRAPTRTRGPGSARARSA